MRQQITLALSDIDPDPDQPRKQFDEAELLALGVNLLNVGQHVPVIVYANGSRQFTLLDGERRWRAATLAGLKEVSAIVLDAKPSATELHLLQISIDVHKAAYSAIERSDLLVRIQTETKWSVSEMAERIGMKQPHVSRLLGFQRLCPEIREWLHRGQIDMEKAFTVSQEPDPAKQLALAKDAKTLSRDQLRARLKGARANAARAAAARFAMPGGVTVLVKARSLTLSTCIEVLIETVKQLKKGQSSGHDINTLPRVMENQCKQLPRSALN